MQEELETAVTKYRQKCHDMIELQDSIFVTKAQISHLALEVETTVAKFKAEKLRLLDETRVLNTQYEKLLGELTSLETVIMAANGHGGDDSFCQMCVRP